MVRNYKYLQEEEKITWQHPTINDRLQQAMQVLKRRPGYGPNVNEKRYSPEEFEQLKKEWVEEHGYTIRIPSLDDIIHVVPTFAKTPQQIHAEKRANLQRILDSPQPEWKRFHTSIMTWIDNIQDTSSIVFPAIKILAKIFPKVMTKIIPYAGWLMLGSDVLNMMNVIGNGPLVPMKAKRTTCKFFKDNPFNKQSRQTRAGRVANYNASWSDIIQALQTTDQLIGVGLCLGPMMGTITDSIFGAYRYATGKPVRFTFDPPNVTEMERFIANRKYSFACVESKGQIFSDELHFWTYINDALTSLLLAPLHLEYPMYDLVEDPTSILLPAPIPTDPVTLQVIQEAGLDPDKGVGWPFNGEPTITLKDLMDATQNASREVARDYCIRHKYDQYGLAAAVALDTNIQNTIAAADPDAEIDFEDPPWMKVFYRMVKTPIIPRYPPTPEQGREFYDWIMYRYETTGHAPGPESIEQKLLEMDIDYTHEYPRQYTDYAKQIWGETFPWEEPEE